MPEIVAVLDTGVFCCWMDIPGKSTAGPENDRWTPNRARTEIDRIVNRGGTLVLPTSTIVEAANFVAQSAHSKRIKAERLLDRVLAASSGTIPWREFRDFDRIWNTDWYVAARAIWPDYAARGVGLADYSVLTISKYFHDLGSEVYTLTTDQAIFAEVGHLPAKNRSARRRR
ncbi:hypothetical protein [uncultured Jannaschia sp.]|uniref:hypothetical protein n=1 Tax=uncultured Jannaschia sp. TaxID=293347 RepID=UPI00262D7F7E|nr:hypothetical protein [uncultured Jannaschia sp.]